MKKIVSVIALPFVCVLAATAGISVSAEHSKAQSITQPSIDLETLRDTSLAKHNEYRKLHGAPALELDEGLNQSSQQWAEYLAKVNEGKAYENSYFEHSENRDNEGENLYHKGTTSKVPDATYLAEDSTKGWYNEINDYDFTNPGKQKPGSEGKMIGHFTQVVWKNTTKMGCGAATSNTTLKDTSGTIHKGTSIFVVCQYSPSGNVTITNSPENKYLRYTQNVLPLLR